MSNSTGGEHAAMADRPTGAEAWDQEVDLVVLGAGVGGLTAALVAAIEGARVLLIEHSAVIGGTSARSSGTVWIADNPEQRAHGITNDAEEAMRYLDALVGDRAPRAMRQAYVDSGRAMVEYLHAHEGLRFQPYTAAPDYRQDVPGAAQGWRPLEPMAFDGRTLGTAFDHVGWPLPELMLFRGMMITRGEAARLLKLGRNWDAFALGFRLLTRYALDRLRFRRGTRLVLGNALVAWLYRKLLDRGGELWRESEPTELVRSDGTTGRVVGVQVQRNGRTLRVGTRYGVVLAGGGFPASPELRERYLPSPVAQYTAAFEGCRGETQHLAQQAGGVLGPVGEDNALWFPSSIAKRPDGSTAVYPHIILDRPKPGLIAVNSAGQRFVNEAVSYHEFTRAMYREHRRTPCIPAYLICDRRFVWRYGLGMILPRTPFLGRYVRNGYLTTARSLPELAKKLGMDPDTLVETVRKHNGYAQTGDDLDFGKGSTTYNRAGGDPEQTPNPCLGPIERPPYCAVAVLPTPLGTSLGVLTDANGQALDDGGIPIPGLYACGNDMHSPLGGEYPGAGSQLGIAMTFGYLAARHAVGGD